MRSDSFRTKFVVNPASANGSTRRVWRRIEPILREDFGDIDVSFTAACNHATELTRKALKAGAEMVVAVGGDGTINEVVNGFFDSGELSNPNAVLGIISRGTGSDFIKTVGIPKQIDAACRALRGRMVQKCDAGRFTCVDSGGKVIKRFFINIADFGIGGETVERVNRTTKAFGGFASFLYGVLSTLVAYKGKKVRVKVDNVYECEKLVNNVVIANGQFFGGGMRIAPYARVDDGLFDILVIEQVTLLESLSSIPKLYKGTHIENPNVEYLKGKTIIAESADVVLLDVEGEQIGRLPAKFEIVPAAINVKVGG